MCGLNPVVKWAGGKRQLLREILPLIPAFAGTYHEPFVGGGAVWLANMPKRATVSDTNRHLIRTYRAVRESGDAVADALEPYENSSECYYAARERFNTCADRISDSEFAALFLYLNRAGYNGLYRVNRNGKLNVPFGRQRKLFLPDREHLRAVHKYLASGAVEIRHAAFHETLSDIGRGDFVYLDPPYDGTFTGYTRDGFRWMDQCTLRGFCDELTERGAQWILSNADTKRVRQLYGHCSIRQVQAVRAINRDGSGRGKVGELLIANYDIRDNTLWTDHGAVSEPEI